ncbi:MAG TPA: LysR family transcriptional regulator [Terriglobales bacterium]|jgi:DNA-binding transcriptional LysR family regulator|nr:LysR family transcriptional regulator [Terriglobales bacterium]
MDFDQLTTFLEVAKLGNFSRAGEKVFRSQSAVSAKIRQLERDYGAKLLDRSGKKVRLTPAGQVLFEYAARLLALRDESVRAVVDQEATPRGVLAIGANEATCVYVLPKIFAEYRRLYPQVQISIYRNFSRKILEKIHDGALDVGVVTMPVKSPRLVVRCIFRDRLMIMASPDNPLVRLGAAPVSRVAEQLLILPKAGYTRQIMDRLFRPYQSRLRIAMELPSLAMIKTFVAAGMGVSLISESLAQEECRSGQLSLLPFEDVELWRELGMVYDQDRTLPRAATALIELVRSGIARNGAAASRADETAAASALLRPHPAFS